MTRDEKKMILLKLTNDMICYYQSLFEIRCIEVNRRKLVIHKDLFYQVFCVTADTMHIFLEYPQKAWKETQKYFITTNSEDTGPDRSVLKYWNTEKPKYLNERALNYVTFYWICENLVLAPRDNELYRMIFICLPYYKAMLNLYQQQEKPEESNFLLVTDNFCRTYIEWLIQYQSELGLEEIEEFQKNHCGGYIGDVEIDKQISEKVCHYADYVYTQYETLTSIYLRNGQYFMQQDKKRLFDDIRLISMFLLKTRRESYV